MTIAFDIHRHSPAAVRRSVGQQSHSAMPKAHLRDSRMPTEIERLSRSGAKILVFGPFRLMPRLRLLLGHDTPSRALDLPTALTERPSLRPQGECGLCISRGTDLTPAQAFSPIST